MKLAEAPPWPDTSETQRETSSDDNYFDKHRLTPAGHDRVFDHSGGKPHRQGFLAGLAVTDDIHGNVVPIRHRPLFRAVRRHGRAIFAEDHPLQERGRLGYRKMAALLRSTSGSVVNDKRVERICRQEGLKVQPRQPKPSLIWPSDGACIRLQAERPNHVWSYDFVEDRTHDGRKYRMLNVVDEFTRECLSIRVNRKLKLSDVIDIPSDLFILRGVPEHIRPDNGSEFVAKAAQDWIAAAGAKTACIEPGSPRENGFVESFNARLRDELLNGGIFYTLAEARVIVESWRRFDNTL